MSNLIARRKFIKMSAGAGMATAIWTPLLEKALAVKANNATRSILDVKHIVILMQENRSFDHYFGAMKGVRGFGDRFPIPLESGKRAFHQSDGKKIIPPYRANKRTTVFRLCEGADFSTKLQSKNRTPNIAQKFQSKHFTRSLAKPMLQADVLSLVSSILCL